MFHYKIGSSGSVGLAEERLGSLISDWIKQSHEMHSEIPLDDNILQGVFTTGWMPWLKLHPQEPAAEWLTKFRDDLDDHFTRKDLQFHGYWRSQGLAYGLAHYLDFLGSLWKMYPEDLLTIEMVTDAAEHLGNWSDAVPAWFDWDSGLFLSTYFGADGASYHEEYAYNIPEHLKALDLALLAYRMSGQSQFLELALVGTIRWADAILDLEAYPLAINKTQGIHHLTGREASKYKEFLGLEVLQEDNTGVRAKAVLEAGGVQLMIKLWQYARDPKLLVATERTLDLLINQVIEPQNSALIGALRFYRNHTGRTRYDDKILQTVEFLFPYFIESVDLSIDTTVRGVDDFPAWCENMHARQHGPLLLGMAAEISGNERLATCTLDLCAAYLTLGRRAYPDGRDNPYSHQTVSAIARGGYKDNGAGIVTEVWIPLRERFCMDPALKPTRTTRKPFSLRLAR